MTKCYPKHPVWKLISFDFHIFSKVHTISSQNLKHFFHMFCWQRDPPPEHTHKGPCDTGGRGWRQGWGTVLTAQGLFATHLEPTLGPSGAGRDASDFWGFSSKVEVGSFQKVRLNDVNECKWLNDHNSLRPFGYTLLFTINPVTVWCGFIIQSDHGYEFVKLINTNNTVAGAQPTPQERHI